jgi:hypothetical protein
MPLIPNISLFQSKLAGFPIATYQAGETVVAAAATTGRLLILRKGAVAVLRDGVEIAAVTEPGAVFGELSVLLDQPHAADAIRDQDCEHRAELEQLVPVAIVAGEPGGVEADHKAGITEANLSDQLLEAVALHAARARFAEILVPSLRFDCFASSP